MLRASAVVTPSGGTGTTASGSETFTPIYAGKLWAVYLDYAANVTSVTDVIVSLGSGTSNPLLTVDSNASDGWYFPRSALVSKNATAVASTSAPFPVCDILTLTVGSSSPITDAVTAYAYIEEQG